MGLAGIAVLILVALVLVGFVAYGICLGMAALVRSAKGAYHQPVVR